MSIDSVRAHYDIRESPCLQHVSLHWCRWVSRDVWCSDKHVVGGFWSKTRLVNANKLQRRCSCINYHIYLYCYKAINLKDCGASFTSSFIFDHFQLWISPLKSHVLWLLFSLRFLPFLLCLFVFFCCIITLFDLMCFSSFYLLCSTYSELLNMFWEVHKYHITALFFFTALLYSNIT